MPTESRLSRTGAHAHGGQPGNTPASSRASRHAGVFSLARKSEAVRERQEQPETDAANEAGADLPPLLRLLPAEIRQHLAAHRQRRVAAAGVPLNQIGEACREVWFIERGLVHVEYAEDTAAASSPLLKPGDYYGGHSVSDLQQDSDEAPAEALHGVQLVPLTETEISVLPSEAIREAARRWPLCRVWADTLGQRPVAAWCGRLAAGPDGERAPILRLIASMSARQFARGEVVQEAGQAVNELRLVTKGQATVTPDDGGPFRVVGPGNLLGATAFLTETPAAETTLATGELEVLVLPAERWIALCDETPSLRGLLARQLGKTVEESAVADIDFTPREAPPGVELPLEDSPRKPRWWERTKLIEQRAEGDCGAACLQMVHAWHGHELDYDAARRMARVSRYGTSLLDLQEAAGRLGYLATAVEADSWESLRSIDLPAIAHVDKNHFVVLWKVGRRTVVISDPATGRQRVNRADFAERFSRYLLLLRPTSAMGESQLEAGADQKQSAPAKGWVKRLWPFVRPHRAALAQVLLASLLLQIFGVAVPLLTQVIIDRVIGRQETGLLNVLFACLVGVAACEALVRFSRNYLLVHASVRLERTVLEAVYKHMLSLAHSFFSRFTTGDLVRRFGEVNEIKNFITESAVTVLLDLLTVVSYTALVVLLQPTLAVSYLAVLAASAAILMVLVRPVRRHTQSFLRKFSGVHTHVIDSFKGIEPVKAMALEGAFSRWFSRLLLPSLSHSRAAVQWSTAAGIAVQLLTAVSAALLLWLGAKMILQGRLSLGELVALMMLTQQLTAPFLRLLQQWGEFQRTVVSLERVGELLQETPETSPGQRQGMGLAADFVRGQIEFDEVCFRYDGDPKDSDRNVIHSLSLKVAPGEVVGIVGRSGCGKSTLARLLLRFHDPSSGRILLDGLNLRDFDPRLLRSQIGLVTQDPFLYSGSLRENIACGREGVTEQDLIRAAQAAGAYEFICQLPYGFETLIGEQGLQLSGGQAQRIAIARALCTNPRILIFDEATAALDPLIEQEIHERLREVIHGRTTIIIAHRLHTLRRADRIVVLDRGRLVEQGGHDELIARRGLYERMFNASPDWQGAGS